MSLLSVWVLVGVSFYLNRYTRRRYFTIWGTAWLFYALWLTLDLVLPVTKEGLLVQMLKQWCVSVSAAFLLWGNARFLGQRVPQRLFGLFMLFLLAWSYIGVYHLEDRLQVQIPIFWLIAVASLKSAWCFLMYRRTHPYVGASLLVVGFLLWGFYLGTYPILQLDPELATADFFLSAVLQLFIAVSMIILVLEEVRSTSQVNLQQLHSHKSENKALHSLVTTTEERYRSLFDQASDAIIVVRLSDLRMLEINRAAAHLLGMSVAEAQQHPLVAVCPTQEGLSADKEQGAEYCRWLCEKRHVTVTGKNGTARASEVEGYPVQFGEQPAYQFFFREMTERAQLEKQLRQAEKLSALGHMISGVAHELNNPLAVIRGYLELILAHHPLQVQTREDLEKIAQESTRAAKLVRNFLAFAREQPARREQIDLHQLISRVTELRRFDFQMAEVEMELQLSAENPLLDGDPDQIQQVLSNLLTNAMQELSSQPLPRRVEVISRQIQGTLQLWVQDNGRGVPQELEAKIFEPFFTTKEVGTGTGLGLSIAHSILSDHQGRIFYQSSLLGGAAFVLEFPVSTQLASSLDPAAQPASTPSETVPMNIRPSQVLVLDDERSIAEMLCEMLGLLGHQTVMSLAPAQALELLKSHSFDLILSDFRMPGMNGEAFRHCVMQKDPALAERIIFLTGDVVNEETQHFLRSVGNPHLAKPFQLSILEKVVNQVLSRHATEDAVPALL